MFMMLINDSRTSVTVMTERFPTKSNATNLSIEQPLDVANVELYDPLIWNRNKKYRSIYIGYRYTRIYLV